MKNLFLLPLLIIPLSGCFSDESLNRQIKFTETDFGRLELKLVNTGKMTQGELDDVYKARHLSLMNDADNYFNEQVRAYEATLSGRLDGIESDLISAKIDLKSCDQDCGKVESLISDLNTKAAKINSEKADNINRLKGNLTARIAVLNEQYESQLRGFE